MESIRSLAIVFLLMSFPVFACSSLTPAEAVPQVETNTSAAPTVEPTVERTTPTAAPSDQPEVLPPATPLADWNGIPIMPGAISGEITDDGYEFTTQADVEEIIGFYETELPNLGFAFNLAVGENLAGFEGSVGMFDFGNKEGATGAIVILRRDGFNVVAIYMNK